MAGTITGKIFGGRHVPFPMLSFSTNDVGIVSTRWRKFERIQIHVINKTILGPRIQSWRDIGTKFYYEKMARDLMQESRTPFGASNWKDRHNRGRIEYMIARVEHTANDMRYLP